MTVKVILEKGVSLPEYETKGSAAVDLRAIIQNTIVIKPGEVVFVSTGIKLDMSEEVNLCAEAMPRSGLGAKAGLVIANTVGLMDNDYQGTIGLYLMNRNPESRRMGMGSVPGESITIEPFDRVAQLRFSNFVQPKFAAVKKFEAVSERGEGGFGSTGKS